MDEKSYYNNRMGMKGNLESSEMRNRVMSTHKKR